MSFLLAELHYHKEAARQQRLAEKYAKEQMEMAMQNKLMTKAEANEICRDKGWGDLALTLEALGLIEFKKEEIVTLYKSDNLPLYGVAKIELWPEGLAVWVGGIIIYKSWEAK